MKKRVLRIVTISLCLILSIFLITSCKDKGPKASQAGLESASDLLMLLEDKKDVAASFKVPAYILGDDDFKYSITWVSDKPESASVATEVVDDEYYVTVKMGKEGDVIVTLTATITGGEFSTTKTFKFTVIKELLITSFEEYKDVPTGTMVSVKGIVTSKEAYDASYKNTTIYIKSVDGNGGFSAYRLKCPSQGAYDEELKIGNTIIITGQAEVRSGLYQLQPNATYILVDTPNVPVTKTDITNDVANDVDLLKYQGHIVEVKNAKVKALPSAGSSGYVVTLDVNGKEFTARITYTQTPKDGAIEKAIADLNLKIGYRVNFYGVMSWFSNPQTVALAADAFTIVSTEVTAEDKFSVVEPEVKRVFAASYHETADVTLPSKGVGFTDVNIAWSIKAGSESIISETEAGKFRVTVDTYEEKTATVIATLSVGDKTKEIEITIKVKILGEAPKSFSSTSLVKGMNIGDTFTKNDLVIAYIAIISGQYDNSYAIAQNTEGSVMIKVNADTTYKVGDKINVTGTLTAGTAGPYARTLYVNSPTITLVGEDNPIPTIAGYVTIDWATESALLVDALKNEKGSGSVDFNSEFGTYIEFTNVKFRDDFSNVAGYAYFKSADKFQAGIYYGIDFDVVVKSLDGSTVNEISKDKFYTVKTYIIGSNGFAENGIIRFAMYEIVEQEGLIGEEELVAAEVSAFETAHAAALALTLETVAAENKEIVQAALTAYNKLLDGSKTALADEKNLLDSLLAEIYVLSGTEDVTISYSGGTEPNVTTSEKDYTSNLVITSDKTVDKSEYSIIGYANDKISNNATQNVGLNKDGTIRLYNEYNGNGTPGNGNSLVISREGYQILSITITYKSNNANGATLLVNGTDELTTKGLAMDGQFNTVSGTSTITFDNLADELVLQNNTIAGTSNQFWIAELIITFVKA